MSCCRCLAADVVCRATIATRFTLADRYNYSTVPSYHTPLWRLASVSMRLQLPCCRVNGLERAYRLLLHGTALCVILLDFSKHVMQSPTLSSICMSCFGYLLGYAATTRRCLSREVLRVDAGWVDSLQSMGPSWPIIGAVHGIAV